MLNDLYNNHHSINYKNVSISDKRDCYRRKVFSLQFYKSDSYIKKNPLKKSNFFSPKFIRLRKLMSYPNFLNKKTKYYKFPKFRIIFFQRKHMNELLKSFEEMDLSQFIEVQETPNLKKNSKQIFRKL
jgi:hypothetical protein